MSQRVQKIMENAKLIYSSTETAGNGPEDISRMLKVNLPITQDNYTHLLMKILDVEENQIKIDIRNYDMHAPMKLVPNAFKTGSHLYKLKVPELAEARPSLLPYDSVYVKISKNDKVKYQGVVHKVLETAVLLGFNYRFEEGFIAKKKYYIEFGFNRRPIRVEKQAVSLANKHNIIPYFYPTSEAMDSRIPETLNYFNESLNDEQKIAVKNIMNRDLNVPYLIFGPPGTGKTVTVVEAVLQLWKMRSTSRILVCAPSNAATNEIATRLIEVMPKSELFRFVGNIYGNDNKMVRLTKIMNVHPDGTFYMPSMEQLLEYRVLLTTLVTAARLVNGGAPKDHFTHVFIDEASYANESQTLIPIAGILSHDDRNGHIKGKIILAGDPRQLGALVHSQFARLCGYGKSMLERLLDTCELYARDEKCENCYDQRYVTKLLKNYRSHRTILTIPNRLFYHNELIPCDTELSEIFANWQQLKTPGFPMIFHHVEGVDLREETSPSFFNVQEIEQVMEYVTEIVNSRVSGMHITQGHVGIITPYRKQVEKLNKALDKKNMDKVLVGSVEQFQGKEKLVIIISTVRSKNFAEYEKIDQKCQLGFLRNPKRFNVALTRAKALLVVVGNGKVLQDDYNWRSFIRYCFDNKSVVGKLFLPPSDT
ncbi:unnamed protein product [Callosobruchus maculatus]|uniref:RNA helicase n=1 Tax=Callosobruchus maculatus TaxID=64391 RepID=A0A653DVP7_CALMS|nr:unnamed protein product [Callosobruchus maculatus]